jgi:hypothetical protein
VLRTEPLVVVDGILYAALELKRKRKRVMRVGDFRIISADNARLWSLAYKVPEFSPSILEPGLAPSAGFSPTFWASGCHQGIDYGIALRRTRFTTPLVVGLYIVRHRIFSPQRNQPWLHSKFCAGGVTYSSIPNHTFVQNDRKPLTAVSHVLLKGAIEGITHYGERTYNRMNEKPWHGCSSEQQSPPESGRSVHYATIAPRRLIIMKETTHFRSNRSFSPVK